MLEHLPHGVGEALVGARAGADKTLSHHPALAERPTQVAVTSAAFGEGGSLDARFTADGEGLSPPLTWSGSPAGTLATVIVVEDVDSPTPVPILHLLAWREGGDGEVPTGAWGPHGVDDDRTGHNSFHKRGWLPPDPPPGHGPHRYLFQVFALDALPDFSRHVAHKHDVLDALKGHVLAMGSVVGVYARP